MPLTIGGYVNQGVPTQNSFSRVIDTIIAEADIEGQGASFSGDVSILGTLTADLDPTVIAAILTALAALDTSDLGQWNTVQTDLSGIEYIGPTHVDNFVRIGSDSSANDLFVHGNTDISGTLTIGSGGEKMTFPTDNGSVGQQLTTDGVGAMSWGAAGGGGATLWTANGSNLYFPTGFVGVGLGADNTPEHAMDVSGNLRVWNGAGLDVSGTVYPTLIADTSNSVVQVTNLTVTATFTNYSDRRLKDNISETKLEGVALLEKLRVVEFNRIDLQGKFNPAGLIAQEVEDVIPSCVVDNLDSGHGFEVKSINYIDMIPILIKCVQELKEENTLLREKISAVEYKVEGLD